MNDVTTNERKEASAADKGALNLSFKVNQIPVYDEDDEETPVPRYFIKQISGTKRDAWLTAMSSRYDATGTLSNFDGMQSSLICLCLWDAINNTPVPQNTIQGWPSPIVLTLFDKCQRLNALGRYADDLVKKV